MRKAFFLLVLICLTQLTLKAQWSENYNYLKDYVQAQKGMALDSSQYLSIYHNQELHYLYPLYKSFKQEPWLIKTSGRADYYADLKQSLAFIGDYAGVQEIEKIEQFSPYTDSLQKAINKQGNPFAGASFKEAKSYILAKTKNSQVVMINEAHEKPQHRVFTASLLEDLYQQGFRYLAMETLSPFPNASLRQVNMLLGHYTCEPLAGELVRKALELGYTLVAYEDSSATHTVNQREYTQAQKIYQILEKEPKAKILVHAGQGHVEEGAGSDGRIPMAAYFKIIAGIDPLTIDQTGMTEGSNGLYGALWYQQYAPKLSYETPMVPDLAGKSVDVFGYHLFDIYVYHPPTKFKNGRPLFSTMNGWKKETAVQPIFRDLFFVQAFYEKEYNEKRVGMLVPADQTYATSPDGYYYLYLQKGRYQVVYRDKQYKILGTKVLLVL